MCGIWALLSKAGIKQQDYGKLYTSFMKIKNRGPEYSSFDLITSQILLGFHRLAIMDLTAEGNQPFHHVRSDGSCVYCVCNGEIYDYKNIKEQYGIITKSGSDCEIILPLYEKIGIIETAKLLGSEFAFIIIDINKDKTFKVFIGRDPIGVRPLFYGINDNDICFSSEMKGLSDIYDKVYVFKPGTIMSYDGSSKTIEMTQYYTYEYKQIDYVPPIQDIYAEIRRRFINCVKKRLMSDVPFGALLSGGFDSSSICGVIKKLMPDKQFPVFTIALKTGSTDLPHAIQCAEYLGLLEHHIIEIDEQDIIDALDETIYAIESYDITSVRASIVNRLSCKYIKEKTNIRVLFGGDGSDECNCSYLYEHYAPSVFDAKEDAIRLVREEHMFDGKRADRCPAYHGLEVRLPYCDPEYIDYILSLPAHLVAPINGIEKYTLREAFANTDTIPESIRQRTKCAFSDAVSKKERSLFNIIQEYIDTIITDEEFESQKDKFKHNTPFTKESYYYRKKFVEFFGDSEEKARIIPHFWMPRWTDAKDPSARVLSVYSEN